MIIGIFTDTFYPEVNGVATSCLNLYQQLQKRGHTVHVYAPKCKGWEALQSDTVHYLESAQFILLKDRNVAFPGMGTIRQALDMHFDVVHTNSEFVMGFLGTYIARHTGCVRVHTYHTVWEDYTYYVTHGLGDNTAKSFAKKYSEWWCDRFDRVIVPTAKTENLLRQYGVEAPIDIIPSGMDLGRFSPEKNHLFLLEVFAGYLRSDPAARLLLVGDGAMQEQIRRRAEALGLGEKVIFAGRTDRVERYYAAMDVFAMPSVFEGFGLAAAEAQANGLPCVLSDRVPELADIGGHVRFLPIGQGTEPWILGLRQAAAAGRTETPVDPEWDIRRAVKRLECY